MCEPRTVRNFDPSLLMSTAEADQFIGGRISTHVRAGRISPAMTLPGKRGAHLYLRSDVERLANELRQELLDELARLDAARQPS